MSKKQVTIKNHISTRVPAISGILEKYFGFTLSDISNACQGDIDQMQKMGELGRQGKLMQKFSPLVREAALQAMKGTSEYNKALADVASAGGKDALTIDKSVSKVIQAESSYKNGILEVAADLAAKKEKESLRHTYTMEQIGLQQQIDKHMVGIEQKSRLEEIANRPDIRQLEIQEEQQIMLGEHLLQYGDLAQPELLPYKSYTLDKKRKGGIFQKILSIFN